MVVPSTFVLANLLSNFHGDQKGTCREQSKISQNGRKMPHALSSEKSCELYVHLISVVMTVTVTGATCGNFSSHIAYILCWQYIVSIGCYYIWNIKLLVNTLILNHGRSLWPWMNAWVHLWIFIMCAGPFSRFLEVVSNASIQHPINPVFVFMYVHINCLILGSEQFIKFQVLVTLSS